jgi:hypothetical protein
MKKSINHIDVICRGGNSILFERAISLEIEKAYSDIRTILLKKGSTIISEEPPRHILIKHGSLRGISPRSAKKVVSYHFSPHELGTQIVGCSSISSDWANLTLWGNIIAGIVATIFWWIATDITSFLVNEGSGYWTWLARAFGYPDIQHTYLMINVMKVLSIVLVVAIFLEIVDFLIVYRKINTFAAKTLDELTQKQVL